jgi:hypothetical protein
MNYNDLVGSIYRKEEQYQNTVSKMDMDESRMIQYFDSLVAPPLMSMFTPQDIEEINRIVLYPGYSDQEKVSLLSKIMKSRGFTIRGGGGGTNRRCYLYTYNPSICIKVAVTNVGFRNNINEFYNQHFLKPYCYRVFEVSPCGTIAVLETVNPIKEVEQWEHIAEDVFNIMWFKIRGRDIAIDDIGDSCFKNWGLRPNFGPVLLDFPSMYKVDDRKSVCRRTDRFGRRCNCPVDYDVGFNNIFCTECGTAHKAVTLSKKGGNTLYELLGGAENNNKIKGVNNMIGYLVDKDGNIVYTNRKENKGSDSIVREFREREKFEYRPNNKKGKKYTPYVSEHARFVADTEGEKTTTFPTVDTNVSTTTNVSSTANNIGGTFVVDADATADNKHDTSVSTVSTLLGICNDKELFNSLRSLTLKDLNKESAIETMLSMITRGSKDDAYNIFVGMMNAIDTNFTNYDAVTARRYISRIVETAIAVENKHAVIDMKYYPQLEHVIWANNIILSKKNHDRIVESVMESFEPVFKAVSFGTLLSFESIERIFRDAEEKMINPLNDEKVYILNDYILSDINASIRDVLTVKKESSHNESPIIPPPTPHHIPGMNLTAAEYYMTPPSLEDMAMAIDMGFGRDDDGDDIEYSEDPTEDKNESTINYDNETEDTTVVDNTTTDITEEIPEEDDIELEIAKSNFYDTVVRFILDPPEDFKLYMKSHIRRISGDMIEGIERWKKTIINNFIETYGEDTEEDTESVNTEEIPEEVIETDTEEIPEEEDIEYTDTEEIPEEEDIEYTDTEEIPEEEDIEYTDTEEIPEEVIESVDTRPNNNTNRYENAKKNILNNNKQYRNNNHHNKNNKKKGKRK